MVVVVGHVELEVILKDPGAEVVVGTIDVYGVIEDVSGPIGTMDGRVGCAVEDELVEYQGWLIIDEDALQEL